MNLLASLSTLWRYSARSMNQFASGTTPKFPWSCPAGDEGGRGPLSRHTAYRVCVVKYAKYDWPRLPLLMS